MLRELELLPVARLYGMETRGMVREAREDHGTRHVQEEQVARYVREEQSTREAPREGLRMLLARRGGEEAERWAFLGDCFDGAAGNLLDNMLASMGVRRDGEAVALVDRDVKRAPPKVIVALGAAAATRLLESESDLAALRGQVHRYDDVPVVVTHDPVYLLTHGAAKAEAWQDLLLARRAASGDA